MLFLSLLLLSSFILLHLVVKFNVVSIIVVVVAVIALVAVIVVIIKIDVACCLLHCYCCCRH